MSNPINLRPKLFSNIVISGGNTMFECLSERLENEICNLAPSQKIKVISHPQRKDGAWMGGSILASTYTFPQMVVSHEQYNEAGPYNVSHFHLC